MEVFEGEGEWGWGREIVDGDDGEAAELGEPGEEAVEGFAEESVEDRGAADDIAALGAGDPGGEFRGIDEEGGDGFAV